MGISQQFTGAIGLSVGTSIALAIATVSGGLGKYLGVAIVATLLHTTGPVGFCHRPYRRRRGRRQRVVAGEREGRGCG